MAYLRFDRSSDWYVFWHDSAATTKEDEQLAIWHCDVRDQGFACTYRDVRAMLTTRDFSRIPGFAERHRSQLVEALNAFVDDVDEEDRRRHVT